MDVGSRLEIQEILPFFELCETLCMARVHFSADCLAAGDPASGGSFKGQLNRQSGKGASPTEVS